MKAMNNKGLKAALVAILGALLLTAGGVAATATASSHTAQTSSDWTHLGGEPLFPGGLTAIAQTQGISLRQAFVFAVTSSRGQTAMAYAGMSPSERRAANRSARMGEFHYCPLKYGSKYVKMSFGVNGTSVDTNVTFRDPRYKNHPASAYCMDVVVGGEVVHMLVPWICVNIAIKNRTVQHIKIITKAIPGKFRVVLYKHAFSSAVNEEQLMTPTPTNTFRFAVRCGLKGKISVIPYQSDPQPAGTCSTKVARVQVWELSTLGPDHWEFLNGAQIKKGQGPLGPLCPCAYQSITVRGRKVVPVVFKDKQMRETTTTTTTTTTVVTTTTPAPKSNVDLCTNIEGTQIAVPAGYSKNPPDVNVPGVCTPPTTTTQTTTTTPAPKNPEDQCKNDDQFPGFQSAPPVGAHRNSDGTCSWNPATTTTQTTTATPSGDGTDLCINIDGTQTQADVNANYRKDPSDAGVPGNCYSK